MPGPVVTLVSSPDLYSPASADIWWQFNSASSSVADFKYVFIVNKVNEVSGALTSLGKYRLPPRPISGDGVFTVGRILDSQITYDNNPYVAGMTACPNSIAKYSLTYGYEFNPNLRFANVRNETGKVGLTFSTAHNLQVNDLIYINKDDKTLNAPYDGTASVVSVPNTLEIITDITYLTASLNSETGYIDSYQRINGTTSNYYAFNGTRQYLQKGVNFGTAGKYLQYNAVGAPITGNTFSLTNWQPKVVGTSIIDADRLNTNLTNGKLIALNEYETAHYLVDNSAYPITQGFVITYDYKFTQILAKTFSYSPNANYHRIELGVGPMNIQSVVPAIGITSSDPTAQVRYYQVGLGSLANGFGIRYYRVKDWDPLYLDSPWNIVRLCWLNRLGGFDYFSFNWKNKNTVQVDRKVFRRNLDWNYTIGQREETVLSQQAIDVYTISSDFIPEVEAEWLKELYTSPEVYWLNGSNQRVPIIVNDSTYEVKRTLTDRQIAVSLSFRVASNINLQQS